MQEKKELAFLGQILFNFGQGCHQLANYYHSLQKKWTFTVKMFYLCVQTFIDFRMFHQINTITTLFFSISGNSLVSLQGFTNSSGIRSKPQ